MVERFSGTLRDEGRFLVERLGGCWTKDKGMCRCPAHDDRRPSLSVRIGRSRLLFHCFAGCPTADVFRALRSGGLMRGAPAAAPPQAFPARDSRISAGALRLWGEARPIAGTPAMRYLAARALIVDSQELRYHPRAPLGPRPLTRFRPAMVAAVRDDAGLVAVHRSFLDLRRNGPLERLSARRALGPLGCGAVRLGGIARRIGLAEGVETALSATVLFGLPCWAVLGTERFGHVALPDEVEALVLFLDNDAGGRRGEALARRAFAQLRSVEACRPRRSGADWNDVLRGLARSRRG